MKRFSFSQLLAYGMFGLPLALVALPVYVYVPQFYSDRFGLSLTLIGAALLVARVFDAFVDPALGIWIDRARDGAGYNRFILIALPMLGFGFLALFNPPDFASGQPFVWFLASLILVYIGFSLATISHQSWGAALTQQRGERARLTAVREACALTGVILAAALPAVAGIGSLSLVFIITLLGAALLLLLKSPRPLILGVMDSGAAALREPFANRRFRWLFGVFALNGIAAAIPATLFLFFATDRLQLGGYAGLFLVLYFAAAALSLPLWVALARRLGESSAWLISMFVAVAAFVWAYDLGSGAIFSFAAICVISGCALGADLALPPALLAAVIAQGGHSGQREGAYFGAWSFATKMNLALAAGISLPLLECLGYVPGTVNATGAHALGIAYALVPCALKLGAAALLWRAPLKEL